MQNKKAILLLSGGIDSTTLLAFLRKENYSIVALSFDYGQKHHIELDYAKTNAKKYNVLQHTIFNLNAFLFNSSALVNTQKQLENYSSNQLPKGQINAYVPFRNMMFISHALSYAETLGIKEIFVAFNKDDNQNFWDCSEVFLEKINQLSNQSASIEVKAPFIHKTKKEVIHLAYQLNVNIEETISCYEPIGHLSCNKCLSCIIRMEAIQN